MSDTERVILYSSDGDQILEGTLYEAVEYLLEAFIGYLQSNDDPEELLECDLSFKTFVRESYEIKRIDSESDSKCLDDST